MKKISVINIGDYAEIEKKIEGDQVSAFSELSEDRNPVHLDEEYASKSRYKRRIAHGFMVSSLFSGLFGTKLPGEGCVYKSQTLKFRRPVYIGDIVNARVEVIDVNVKKKVITFATTCYVDNKVVINGIAEIFIP